MSDRFCLFLRKKEEGRKKKEEGRRNKEEGRRKKEKSGMGARYSHCSRNKNNDNA
ncbi:MAG: hypothetical protein F6K39_22190 [Okeania sp. SIO3B3]|nr:hypothetical protein [Okeania sp. SIO3B3]